MSYNRDVVLLLKHTKNLAIISLNKPKVKLILGIIHYYNLIKANKDNSIADDPTQWHRNDFKDWKQDGQPISTAMYTASLANANANTTENQSGSTRLAISATKDDDDVFISWRRARRDPTQYVIFEADEEYTDWIIKIIRQFKINNCNRMIDQSFMDNQVVVGLDSVFFDLQMTFMSIVLERVLKTANGLRLA